MENETTAASAETTAPESAPEEVAVTEPTNDSEVAETQVEEVAEVDVNVPLHENPRFREVYQEMKTAREELAELKKQVQSQAPTQESAPEPIPQNLIDPMTGEVDPVGYQNWVAQRAEQRAVEAARREFASQQAYMNAWQDAEKSYPELSADKELRGMVDAMIRGEFSQGNVVTPKEAADKVFKRLKATEAESYKKAQASVETQKQSSLEVNQNQVQIDESGNLYEQAKRGENVREFIKNII